MVDLDLLDEEALRKLQTLLKQRDQENLKAASITLDNQSFNANTLEEERAIFPRKYSRPKRRLSLALHDHQPAGD